MVAAKFARRARPCLVRHGACARASRCALRTLAAIASSSTEEVHQLARASNAPHLPSLQRLRFSGGELSSLLDSGRREGPLIVYKELVQRGYLEWSDAQLSCGQVLQDLWGSLPKGEATPSRGCYIWGSVGAGKSLLIDIFAECCRLKVRRVHFHEFMEDVHRRMQSLRQSGAQDKSTRAVAKALIAEGTEVFVLDEFQITNISDALIVESLLSFMFEGGIFLVVSTNRPPRDLYKHGLNRHLAIPKLLELFAVNGIAIHEVRAGKDFRVEETTSGGEFRDFILTSKGLQDSSDSSEVEQCIRSVFSEASGAVSGVSQQVRIAWGRSMTVSEVSGGVARFTFQELCAGHPALCAEDYLQLALQFHTILMTDVPPFSVDMHNEARRFTNLIDCLYEHHARLVISSEAPLPELLQDMESFAGFSIEEFLAMEIPDKRKGAAVLGPRGKAEDYWLKRNGWQDEQEQASLAIDWTEEQRKRAEEMAKIVEALEAAAPTGTRGGNATSRNWTGDDSNSTGAGEVAGVMSGAVGSLQESGFAARRAMSRLMHMQSDAYLEAHRRHRLQE